MESPTKAQKYNLITDYLQSGRAVVIDAMQTSWRVHERYGVRVDHHLCAEILDMLQRQGQAEVTSSASDGFTLYKMRRLTDDLDLSAIYQ